MPTLEEIATLLKKECANSAIELENKLAPMRKQIEQLKENQEAAKDGTAERKLRLLQRKAEFTKWISEADTELSQMNVKTWEKPIAPLDGPSNITVMLENPPGQRAIGGTRFRAETLPKYHFGEDVDIWITEMDHIVSLQEETIVCLHIFSNCFDTGDIM